MKHATATKIVPSSHPYTNQRVPLIHEDIRWEVSHSFTDCLIHKKESNQGSLRSYSKRKTALERKSNS